MRFVKNNRVLLKLLDSIVRILFFIPLLYERQFFPRPSESHPQKILILEPWGIGDLMMMNPILKPLRVSFPEAQIFLLSKDYAITLFQEIKCIDEFIVFDFPWTHFSKKYRLWSWPWIKMIKLTRTLRREKIDLVLDARGDFRNNLIGFLSGVKRRMGYGDTGGAYFLTDVIEPGADCFHRSDRWLKLLRLLNITVSEETYCVGMNVNDNTKVDLFLKSHGITDKDILIGVHPGAAVPVRRWSLENFSEIAHRLKSKYKAKIVIILPPDGLASHIAAGESFVRFQGSLGMLVALIRRFDLLVCNDSGPMHIADGLNIPTVAIFGPGAVNLIGPRHSTSNVVLKEEMPCRPCFDRCIYNEPYCLTQLETNVVFDWADRLLREIVSAKPLSNFEITASDAL